MRPFVVYIKPSKNNNIILTREEFEQYIQEAYDKGYADGKALRDVTIAPLTNPSFIRGQNIINHEK